VIKTDTIKKTGGLCNIPLKKYGYLFAVL